MTSRAKKGKHARTRTRTRTPWKFLLYNTVATCWEGKGNRVCPASILYVPMSPFFMFSLMFPFSMSSCSFSVFPCPHSHVLRSTQQTTQGASGWPVSKRRPLRCWVGLQRSWGSWERQTSRHTTWSFRRPTSRSTSFVSGPKWTLTMWEQCVYMCVCTYIWSSVSLQDEQRLKCYCVAASPVNHAQETRRRIEEIKTMIAWCRNGIIILLNHSILPWTLSQMMYTYNYMMHTANPHDYYDNELHYTCKNFV